MKDSWKRGDDKWLNDLEKKLIALREKERERTPITSSAFVTSQVDVLHAEFFRAIERIAPEVISSLSDEVFPIYKQAFPKKRPWKLKQLGKSKKAVSFINKLENWGKKWNLTADWTLDIACFLLSFWASRPSLQGKIAWLPTGKGMAPPIVPIIRIEPWEPWKETEKEFERRVKKVLDKHKRIAKVLYKTAAWIEPPQKRARSGPVLKHFDWLVLYQVKGLRMRDIANYYEKKTNGEVILSEDTVGKAVCDMARKMGLTLRPSIRGGR